MTRIIAFIVLFHFTWAIQAQPIIYINAGSRASYGNYQELTIDADGSSRYYLHETNGITKDSSSFELTRQELDSFFIKVSATGFFNLKTKYDSGLADGAGIFISLNSSGRKHSVHLLNTDVAAINELIQWLNSVLASRNIRIYYGQKQQP